MATIRELNDSFANKACQLEAWSKQKSLLQTEASGLLDRFNEDYNSPAELVQLLHETQRVSIIFAAGAQNNKKALDAVKDTSSIWWKDAPELPADEALQQRVGEQFLEAPLTKPGANIRIGTQPFATKITEHVVAGYVERGENFDLAISDTDWAARLVNALDEKAVHGYGKFLAERAEWTEKAISIAADTGEEATPMDKTKANILRDHTKPFSHKSRSIDNFFTLTVVPTPRDAKIDGMDYESYLKLFFELCDQPWDAITKAQEKLIEQFDAAKELHITNDDGTDVTLNIEGMTFCNSVVKKNIPGSEIFSAPHRDGVNGTVVAKGRFSYHDGDKVIENMTLTFKNGEVVDAKAEKGEDILKDILSKDEGARFPGEIGIGTNPWLKQHVMNGLLVEKIGGSFHIALGACYDYDTYDGHPVNVRNGNSSSIHWDLTTMLKGRGGEMYLDGTLIQQNGEFLDPDFAVFNKGWEALPAKERPDYWKERLKAERGKPQQQVRAAS